MRGGGHLYKSSKNAILDEHVDNFDNIGIFLKRYLKILTISTISEYLNRDFFYNWDTFIIIYTCPACTHLIFVTTITTAGCVKKFSQV